MWECLSEKHTLPNIVTSVQLHAKLAHFPYSGQVSPDLIDGFEKVSNRISAMDSSVSDLMEVSMVRVAFRDMSKSAYGHVVSSMQTMESEIPSESATARLPQEYAEKIRNF